MFGYVDQGGKGIVQASIDSGAFSRFVFADGMISQTIIDAVGDDLIGSFGTRPGGNDAGSAKFLEIAKGKVAGDGGGPYDSTSYDAGALIALAIQAAGSADRAAIQSKVMSVANAPGEKIHPGEIAKGLKILADGGEIDYVGATNVEFSDIGEVFGTYMELEVTKGKFSSIKVH